MSRLLLLKDCQMKYKIKSLVLDMIGRMTTFYFTPLSLNTIYCRSFGKTGIVFLQSHSLPTTLAYRFIWERQFDLKKKKIKNTGHLSLHIVYWQRYRFTQRSKQLLVSSDSAVYVSVKTSKLSNVLTVNYKKKKKMLKRVRYKVEYFGGWREI